MNRFVAALALAGACTHAAAQAPAPAPQRTWALVSAVGGKLHYVRDKSLQAGSHLEPYQRVNIDVPGTTIDTAVFRGLESIVRENDPEADVVYLRLDPRELEGVPAYNRGEVAIGKLAGALDKMPERQMWHRIVVITPNYLQSEREGLASKLHGIGYYVKRFDTSLDPGEFGFRGDDEVVTPDGKPTRMGARNNTFIAPYFYARIWILDAKTLKVLEMLDRYDYQRIHDPVATALNIEVAIPAERLAPAMARFYERAAAGTLRDAIGVVTVSDPKVVGGDKAAPR